MSAPPTPNAKLPNRPAQIFQLTLGYLPYGANAEYGQVAGVELSRYRGKPKITYIPVFHQNNIHHVKKSPNPKPIRLAALHFKRPLTAWPTTLP